MKTKLNDAILYNENCEGKKIRSTLLFLVTTSYNQYSEHPDFISEVAKSIEMVHDASLIVDDLPVFDNADVRRGKTTIHSKFGSDTAILASTYLIFDAIQNIVSNVTEHYASEIIDELTEAGKNMCIGQSMESIEDLDKPRIRQYNNLKTASLFKAICRIGAILCDRDPYDWNRFGNALGDLYQAYDDIHDQDNNDKYAITDIDVEKELNNAIACIPDDIDGTDIVRLLNGYFKQ